MPAKPAVNGLGFQPLRDICSEIFREPACPLRSVFNRAEQRNVECGVQVSIWRGIPAFTIQSLVHACRFKQSKWLYAHRFEALRHPGQEVLGMNGLAKQRKVVSRALG